MYTNSRYGERIDFPFPQTKVTTGYFNKTKSGCTYWERMEIIEECLAEGSL
jgi:hypothetical protein